MGLEDRLHDLVSDGRKKAAVELSRAVIKHDDVGDVTVEGDTVRVETERFEGVHAIVDGADDRRAVESGGTYTPRSDRLEFTFETQTMNDRARALAERALAPDARADPGGSNDRAKDNGGTPAAARPATVPDGAADALSADPGSRSPTTDGSPGDARIGGSNGKRSTGRGVAGDVRENGELNRGEAGRAGDVDGTESGIDESTSAASRIAAAISGAVRSSLSRRRGES